MSHYRFCPLSGNCVIISKHRSRRPSDYSVGGFEPTNTYSPFTHGNEDKTPPEIFAIRDNIHATNQPGWKVRVVPNKYNALDIAKEPKFMQSGLYDTMDGFGAHEVVIDTPRFPHTIYDFSAYELELLLEAIRVRSIDLSRDIRIKYILPFKNNGPLAGATIAHPHSQIIGMPFIPFMIENEISRCKSYFEENGRTLMEDMVNDEISAHSRVVAKSNNFLAYCPFASQFPFSIFIAPINQKLDFLYLDMDCNRELSTLLHEAISRLGRAIEHLSFNMIFRLRPPIREDKDKVDFYKSINDYYGWRIEILPRLAFDGGYEVGSGIRINSVIPEEAAEFLRNVKL